MTKSTATIATFLALLTGLVLGQFGPLAVPRPQSAASGSTVTAQELETARSFYDGMNRFLTSGDRAVETMLALDFVDYSDSLPSGRNAEQLMVNWSAIRSLLPHLQFEVVGLQETGSLVEVRLEVAPGTASSLPNIPLDAPPAGSVIEFLRIEDSKVAERWSSDDRWPGMAMTLHADFDGNGPDLSGPVIQRFSLAAGQETVLSGKDRVALLVTSGEIHLDRTGIDPNGQVHPSSEPLAGGQVRIVAVKDTLFLRNPSGTAAEFLAFGLYALVSTEAALPDRATAIATPTIAATALAYMPLRLNDSSSERLRMSVSEITLPAGAWVASHTPNVVVQIVVLDGTVEASVQTGRALVSQGNGRAQPFEGVETVSAGQGFSASSIATLSYRVTSAQPATLLIMTIEPAP